jgi:hypothetical protein
MVSCDERPVEEDDHSAFYLPEDSLDNGGLRYIYRSLIDTSLDREVWEHIKTSEGHITSINYDHRQQVVQKQYERFVANGVVIDSLILFFEDSMGNPQTNNVNVLSPHKFPFDARDSSQVYLTHLEWWQPGDSLHVVLERRRRYLGPTRWEWQGKELRAIVFSTHDKFETEEVGWTSSEWSGDEIYAENIGLVYYRRSISPQLQIVFQLERIEKIE